MPGGAAQKAGLEPGDVISRVQRQTRRQRRRELQNTVTSTKPGTSVPVKVIRDKKERTINVVVDELDLEAEQGNRQTRNQTDEPAEQGGDSFGLTLANVTPQTVASAAAAVRRLGCRHHRRRSERAIGWRPATR